MERVEMVWWGGFGAEAPVCFSDACDGPLIWNICGYLWASCCFRGELYDVEMRLFCTDQWTVERVRLLYRREDVCVLQWMSFNATSFSLIVHIIQRLR